MSRNFKRRIIIGIMMYIMVNCFAWGLMKAYTNSHNCVSHDKLAMAQISDAENGKKVSIIGGSVIIPDEIPESDKAEKCLRTLIPIRARAAMVLFFGAAEKFLY